MTISTHGAATTDALSLITRISPHAWRVITQTGRMVGALVLANVGSRLSTGALGNAFPDGAQRLADAAMSR
jgi:hypothetical protein